MNTTYLLITGSRALCDSPQAEQWARELITTAFSRLPLYHRVVVGDAAGPDTWALSIARETFSHARVFTRDGAILRFDNDHVWSEDPDRWSDDTTRPRTHAEWRDRLLARNRAMVMAINRVATGSHVRVLGLRCSWSPTHGTEHTLSLARRAFGADRVTEAIYQQ